MSSDSRPLSGYLINASLLNASSVYYTHSRQFFSCKLLDQKCWSMTMQEQFFLLGFNYLFYYNYWQSFWCHWTIGSPVDSSIYSMLLDVFFADTTCPFCCSLRPRERPVRQESGVKRNVSVNCLEDALSRRSSALSHTAQHALSNIMLCFWVIFLCFQTNPFQSRSIGQREKKNSFWYYHLLSTANASQIGPPSVKNRYFGFLQNRQFLNHSNLDGRNSHQFCCHIFIAFYFIYVVCRSSIDSFCFSFSLQ